MDSASLTVLRQHLQDSGRTLRDFGRLWFRQFDQVGSQQSAAALTYTSLFAIVPIMTMTYSVLALIPALKSRAGHLQSMMLDNFVPSASSQVQEYLQEFSRQTANLTLIGGLLLVVTSLLLLRNIENTMNRIWQVPAARRGVVSLLMYWAVLTLGPLLLGAGIGMSSYLTSSSIFNDTANLFGGVRLWLSWLPLVFTTIFLALLYIIVPNCHVPYRQGLLGAFLAACAFELAKWGFTLFIRQSPNYEVIYGAFAAVPLFLLWLYISWLVVIGGAVLVRTLTVFSEYRSDPPRLQALLRLVEVLWKKQQQGGVLRPALMRRVLHSSGATRWEEYRNLLLSLGLIRRTDDGDYVLTQDLRTLTLHGLMLRLPWSLADQLRVNEDLRRPWEQALVDRCEAASASLAGHLDVDLETLFLSGDLNGEPGPDGLATDEPVQTRPEAAPVVAAEDAAERRRTGDVPVTPVTAAEEAAGVGPDRGRRRRGLRPVPADAPSSPSS